MLFSVQCISLYLDPHKFHDVVGHHESPNQRQSLEKEINSRRARRRVEFVFDEDVFFEPWLPIS